MVVTDSVGWWLDVLSFVGMGVSAIGAGWAAKSVILTEDDAIEIGLPRFAPETRAEKLTNPMVQSLLGAAKGARIGLWTLVIGTVLQAVPMLCRLVAPLV